MTLREHIHTLLRDNAALRTLLGKSTTPYGIYQEYPHTKLTLPVVTHRLGSYEGGELIKYRNYEITAWGDNCNAIAEKIYDILNNTITCPLSDFSVLKLSFSHSTGEMFDQNYDQKIRKDTYKCIIIRK